MSVSKMKKLTVFAHKQEESEIIKRLVRLRCVDVSPTENAQALSCAVYNCDRQRAALESSVADINEAMTVLNKYQKRAGGIFKSKSAVNSDAFIRDGYEKQARFTVSETLATVARQNAVKAEIGRAETIAASAVPYMEHDLPLGFSETEYTDVLLGVLPSTTDLRTLGHRLADIGAVARILLSDNTGIYVSVICHKNDTPDITSALMEYGFIKSSFKGVDKTAKAYIAEMKKRVADLQEEYASLDDKLSALADNLCSVEILYDIEQTDLNCTLAKQKMVSTESVVMLTGWIPEPCKAKVCALLDKYDCAYDLAEPEANENPPILLKNNGFASNFEWVLGMYSYPAYGRFDPTFIMSICYFVIFGIMFADAGYGLLLILGCLGGLKLLKPSEGMERFLKMFAYCGISCIVFGVLFGAYFGDLPLAIMKNMMGIPEAELPNLALLGSSAANLAILFDPLQNPMGFLIVSLGIGAVHLIAGMAVKFVILCREGQAIDAILDIGAYWALFAGIGLLFVVPAVGKWVLIGSAALIVLTHGRQEKNIVMKFLKGLLGLYDLISYASDLLSYSRILALGLAAGVIAQVVNILATMMGPSVVGFIVLVLAFIVGHLLNMVINVLGTFVHTSRLQYIEFFNKFYEDGGVAFEPVTPSDKYTVDDGE